MPTVPRARDSGNVSGHSASTFSSFSPSEMECVVQPEGATTIVPIGKAEFLLSTTLKERAHSDTWDPFLSRESGCYMVSVHKGVLSLIVLDQMPYHISPSEFLATGLSLRKKTWAIREEFSAGPASVPSITHSSLSKRRASSGSRWPGHQTFLFFRGHPSSLSPSFLLSPQHFLSHCPCPSTWKYDLLHCHSSSSYMKKTVNRPWDKNG